MNVLQELEDFINDFNKRNDVDLHIDSIRVEFSKQHKLEAINSLGKWKKMKKNSPIVPKLKKRLAENEITSVWRLDSENIYYYNKQDAPKYRRSTLVIFGITQYHKPVPERGLINNVLQILKDVTSVDICIDMSYKPNLDALSTRYQLTPYITNNGVVTDTRYINDTGIPMLDTIIFYNKALKNGLKGTLWRAEAKISIPNFRVLALPLHEFKEIIDIGRIDHD